ncbi:hypothetical protein LPJ64_005427 [Coemansia asiatica]|uniref:Uncharacterized protein n=1 Tax=Coemansia asiatica TaxID=1052880 RepID=A0A9W8CHN7_9FUNG|nr:hypothetical protein LPJ64_005427 [Coemansia asiatica]
MSRLWTATRKHSYMVLSALAVVGLFGYLAYEVYQETTATDSSDEPPSLPPTAAAASSSQDEDDQEENAVEDVINIADELARSTSINNTNNIGRNDQRLVESQQTRPQPLLTLSARGTIFSSKDPQDPWSSKTLELHPQAREILWHLTSRYNVYLIAVVEEEEDKNLVLRFLEEQRIIGCNGLAQVSSSLAESMVWVDRSDGEGSRGSSISAPSSDISAILASSTADGSLMLAPSPLSTDVPLGRDNVLFCQTEEGKAHLVRHLLTLPGSTRFVPAHPSYVGFAGHADTNGDVVKRLAPVLARIVHVDGAIGCGEVPNANTAFSTSSYGNCGSSTSLSSLRAAVERVPDITQSSIY